MNTETKLEMWAIVELMGHQKIAGWCTETPIAGTNMLRVDVPETSKQPAFTRLLGSTAIYAINPVDESTAKMMAERIKAAPIDAYDAMAAIERLHPEVRDVIEAKRISQPSHSIIIESDNDEPEFD